MVTQGIHSTGQSLIDDGAVIGDGTQVGAWVHISARVVIGKDCRIGDHVVVQDGVSLGDRVHISTGVCVREGTEIESDVVIDSGVVIAHVCGSASAIPAKTTIRQGAAVGANVTLYAVEIGEHAFVCPGAVVTSSVPPFARVAGNPAEIVGYVGADPVERQRGQVSTVSGVQRNRTAARLQNIPSFTDMRGSLSAIEWHKQVPFEVSRLFYTYNTPSSKVRGEHAHKECHQFLIAVAGSLHVIADDGLQREEFVLDSPALGLYLPPRIWGVQYKQAPNTVLLVLASHQYDPGDYIRDYGAFVEYVKAHQM